MTIRYPGGKSRLRNKLYNQKPYILDFFKNDKTLISMFCGAAHFELTQRKNEKLWLNDINSSLFCFWDIIATEPEKLIKKVEKYNPSLSTFKKYRAELKKLNHIPALEEDVLNTAFKKLVIHQCSFSGLGEKGGVLGGEKQNSQYKIDCRWKPRKIIKRIKRAHSKIKKSKITNWDFRKVFKELEKINKEEIVLFLDPPYFDKSDALYFHSFSKEDHKELLTLIKSLKIPFVLTYDDCDWVKQNYSWANIDEIDSTYKITAKEKLVKELIIHAYN